MVKIIEKAPEVDLAAQLQEANDRREKRGFRRLTLDVLHVNQPIALAEHLRHDTIHRLLPEMRARTRNTHPDMIGTDHEKRRELYSKVID